MQTQTRIQCSACRQPIDATIRTYIDVAQDPKGKMLLLTGRLNTAPCPNCETVNAVGTPLLYHDPSKELLIAYVPMELNLPKDGQEKVIGDLMNRMPKSDFKGYMFNPKRALTMQGLVDQILEADGVTPEMMEEQRERVKLAQRFIEAEAEEDILNLVQEYDEQIDAYLFQIMTAMAQRASEGGQMDIAQIIVARQNLIAEASTFGQEALRRQEEQESILHEVAAELQKFGPDVGRTHFLELALVYMDRDGHLQALVRIARPAFDYEFFQMLTARINQTAGMDQESLTDLRTRLLALTEAIDKQTQLAMQNAASFLQVIINHNQPAELIRANPHMIDDTFMAVIAANIQQAENADDQPSVERLKEVYDLVMGILQENMQPELRFINELLSTADDQEAQAMIREYAGEFDDTLFEVFDAVEQVLEDQGNQPMVDRLRALRAETEQVLS